MAWMVPQWSPLFKTCLDNPSYGWAPWAPKGRLPSARLLLSYGRVQRHRQGTAVSLRLGFSFGFFFRNFRNLHGWLGPDQCMYMTWCYSVTHVYCTFDHMWLNYIVVIFWADTQLFKAHSCHFAKSLQASELLPMSEWGWSPNRFEVCGIGWEFFWSDDEVVIPGSVHNLRILIPSCFDMKDRLCSEIRSSVSLHCWCCSIDVQTFFFVKKTFTSKLAHGPWSSFLVYSWRLGPAWHAKSNKET